MSSPACRSDSHQRLSSSVQGSDASGIAGARFANERCSDLAGPEFANRHNVSAIRRAPSLLWLACELLFLELLIVRNVVLISIRIDKWTQIAGKLKSLPSGRHN